jgi:5-methylcytosine-specific restriction endonuclease McrA
MKKEIRKSVYDKYGGHCAYCGKEIAYKDMQVDHKVPIYRGYGTLVGVERGTDDIDNLMPSCRSCNFRKGTMSVDEFRDELVRQCKGIIKRSFQVRQSIDYGLISVNIHPITFYYEKINKDE